MSHEGCYGESSVSAVIAKCETQPLGDLIQEDREKRHHCLAVPVHPNNFHARLFEVSIPRRQHSKQQDQ